ncbi:MAG: hypothetical protein K9I95_00695 [Flavobacteriaceae bacterium]|nr:hypothetical protein [Flavobacteriaceae bacterium]
MIKQLLKYLVLIHGLLIINVGCTKDVDFGQVNDIVLTPVVESSLIYINEPTSRFLVEGVEVSVIQDFVNINIFQETFTSSYLIKAVLFIETNNTINRAFIVQVDFLDDLEQLQHTFSFSSAASPTNSPIVTEHEEVFENASLERLKNTTKLVFTLKVLPGEPINNSTPGRIILKSKGSFYLNIEN